MAASFVKGGWVELGQKEIAVTATAGNWLVSFMNRVSDAGSEETPIVEDNEGTGGWTIHATHQKGNAGASSSWVAYKKATGGETVIKWTARGTGTVSGLGYAEISGSNGEVGTIGGLESGAASKEQTTSAFTVNAGEIAFIWLASATAVLLGAAEEWTGNGPALNPGGVPATQRGYYGYYAAATTQTSKTYTAHHATSRGAVPMLWITFKASTETKTVAQAKVTGAGKPTTTQNRIALASAAVTGAGKPSTTQSRIALATARATGGGAATASTSKLAKASAVVTGAGSARATISTIATVTVSAKVTGAGNAHVSASRIAPAVGRVTGGGQARVTALKVASATGRVTGAGKATVVVTSITGVVVTALVHGGGRASATVSRTASFPAHVTGAGRATVTVTGVHPTPHFPTARPEPGRVAVGQGGRLSRVLGRVSIPNTGRRQG